MSGFIPEWCAVTTYMMGSVVEFNGVTYTAKHAGLLSVNPETDSIRIPVSVNIERRFFTTTVTKEFEIIKPWEKD